MSRLARFALLFFFFASFSIQVSQADSPRTIPPKPCDFYGVEQSPGTLPVNSIITAQDPNGVIIGQFAITNAGRYGFLSTQALDGDIITFYLDGVKQQKQAVYKSGEAIQVDLGVPTTDGAFNLHLIDVPGYSNYQANPNYSGSAVADMIIDYLKSSNTDTQADLMSYADLNSDGVISSSEMERLLNKKVGSPYNFGSTATINKYSSWGIIDQFSASNQSDCIKQICHWLAYKVPNAPAGREYVPVAISTSADPALNADSDYAHWMSVVGIKTNQDPFPNLSTTASFREEYRAPGSLQLYGVYLSDPGQAGLGFHTYMSADTWTTQYFRPMASGLEGAGTYVAIMEPPDPKAVDVQVSPAPDNSGLKVTLGIPEKGTSILIPRLTSPLVRNYLLNLLKRLNQSPDFATLIQDRYFGEALNNSEVKRCFKVKGTLNPDYTIVPFEKKLNNKLATTLAVIVNNQTGQFRMASADNKASGIYSPMPFYEAYLALRKQISWMEYPVNYWLSNTTGSALSPGWSVQTMKYSQLGPVLILNTNEYTVTSQKKVTLEKSSPEAKILYTRLIRIGKEWIKLVSFKVNTTQKYTVTVDKRYQRGRSSLLRNQDTWLLMLRGGQDMNCRLEVKGAYSTSIYIRK